MKKLLKRTLSVFIAVTMLFGTATLSGIANIDLSEFSNLFDKKAEASDGCLITNSYSFGNIFSGYYNSINTSEPCLVEGQAYWLGGNIQYAFCGYNSYPITHTIPYEIKNSSGNTVYSSTSEGYYESGIFKYDLFIPSTLPVGRYSLYHTKPTIWCDDHLCSYNLGISLSGETFNVVDADCPIETNMVQGIFENFESSEINHGAILYAGEDYILQGKNQYVFCNQFYSSVDSSIIEYKITGAWGTENYGAIYYTGTTSQSLNYETGIATYSVYIPDILQEGTYEIDLQFPGICCDGHLNSTEASLCSVFNIVQDYFLTYDANGGNGAPSSQSEKGIITLSSSIPERFSYSFLGWSTNPNASSADYLPGSSLNLKSNTTLYAVWQQAESAENGSLIANSATVNIEFPGQAFYYYYIPTETNSWSIEYFDYDDFSGKNMGLYLYDSNGNLLDSSENNSGKNKIHHTLNAGEKYYIKINSSVAKNVCIGMLKARTYTVSYDANGGSGAPESQSGNTTYTVSSVIPIKTGYNFLGWSTSSTATYALYYAEDKIIPSSNMILYAVWEADPNYIDPDDWDVSATKISIGKETENNIDPTTEIDMYSFTAPNNGKATIDFKHDEITDSTKDLSYFVITVYDSSRKELCSFDSYGYDASTKSPKFNVEAGSKYYITVEMGCVHRIDFNYIISVAVEDPSEATTKPTTPSTTNICPNCGRMFTSEKEYNAHINSCKTEPTKPATKPTEPTTRPAETEPSTKPVEVPSTTKPAETEPSTKPVEVPTTTKPAETEPSTKPVEVPSTTKPVETEPSTKPVEVPSTTKPAETKPSTKPSVPSTEPTTKPVTPPVTETKATVEIRKPSQTEIKYGDNIVLHAEVENMPEGAKVMWSVDNGNFKIVESAESGKSCIVTPVSSGETVFFATLVDADGNVIATDTQTMTSKAGFFQKIIAFFKKLFGMTKVYPEIFKGIF